MSEHSESDLLALLKRAFAERRLDTGAVAGELGVSPRTAERYKAGTGSKPQGKNERAIVVFLAGRGYEEEVRGLGYNVEAVRAEHALGLQKDTTSQTVIPASVIGSADVPLTPEQRQRRERFGRVDTLAHTLRAQVATGALPEGSVWPLARQLAQELNFDDVEAGELETLLIGSKYLDGA